MSPRTGRPKVESPKVIEVKVRFDEETNAKILEYCNNNNITRTEMIRKGISLVLEQKK